MVPPFLVRVLLSRVPRCHQYYGTLRLPAPTIRSLMDSLPDSSVLLHIRSVWPEAKPDSRVLFNHRTNGDFTLVSAGPRRFLKNPSCTFAPVSDPGRAENASPFRQLSADPIPNKMKSPTGA